MIFSMTKRELANACNITGKTLQTWLNVIYFEELKKIGYRKTQKVLHPKQVEFILGKQDITREDLKLKSHAI